MQALRVVLATVGSRGVDMQVFLAGNRDLLTGKPLKMLQERIEGNSILPLFHAPDPWQRFGADSVLPRTTRGEILAFARPFSTGAFSRQIASASVDQSLQRVLDLAQSV